MKTVIAVLLVAVAFTVTLVHSQSSLPSEQPSNYPTTPVGTQPTPATTEPSIEATPSAPTESTTTDTQSDSNANVGDFSCTYNYGGGTWDLTRLRGGSDITGTSSDSYQYTMNPCGQVGGVCTGKGNTPMICQANGGLFESVIAYSGKEPSPVWAAIDSGNPAKGAQVTFKNGDYCWASPTKTREAVIKFTCDPSAPARPTTFKIFENPACTFTIDYPNSAVCPGGGAGADSGGLSGGSAFLIILFVTSFVYIAAGCVYKRKKMGTVGWVESMPNIDFWRSIPGYVKDGILFTRAKISGARGIPRSTYEQL